MRKLPPPVTLPLGWERWDPAHLSYSHEKLVWTLLTTLVPDADSLFSSCYDRTVAVSVFLRLRQAAYNSQFKNQTTRV